MPNTCPQCGQRNIDGAVRCASCDTEIPHETRPVPLVRTWLLALLATIVISAIGAAALKYVHDTAVPLGNRDRAELAAADPKESFAAQQPDAQPREPVGVGVTVPAPVAPVELPSGPAANTGARQGSTLEPLPANENPLIPGGADADNGYLPTSGTLAWSRSILPPVQHAPAATAATEPTVPTLPEAHPIAVTPALSPAPTPSVGQPPRAEPVPAVAVATISPAPTMPTPPAVPAPAGNPTLADAQDRACANEGLLGGFVCRERVRLRFCEARWNKHPDCMVQRAEANF